jgi:phosphatidylglycerol:prolipoprotein diacylglycerol transferase
MPDAQLGFIALNWVTMGQILSTPMIIIGALLFYYAYKKRYEAIFTVAH